MIPRLGFDFNHRQVDPLVLQAYGHRQAQDIMRRYQDPVQGKWSRTFVRYEAPFFDCQASAHMWNHQRRRAREEAESGKVDFVDQIGGSPGVKRPSSRVTGDGHTRGALRRRRWPALQHRFIQKGRSRHFKPGRKLRKHLKSNLVSIIRLVRELCSDDHGF